MEEQLRAFSLRVRWRLVVGLICALLAVGVTLPAASAEVNLGARLAEIWPNPTPAGDDPTLTNLPLTEVIWPNGVLVDDTLGQ